MPLPTNQEAPPKKRIREKHNVNIGSGSLYIDLYNNQDRKDALDGTAMSTSDSIYVNAALTHLTLEATLITLYGSVPSTYTLVSVVEPETTDFYVKEISHYEAWT